MEGAFTKIIETLLSQGGAYAALSLISLLGAIWMFRRGEEQNKLRAEENAKCEQRISDLYEKRIEDARLISQALERSNTTMVALTQSIESRNVTLNELAKGLAALAQTQQSQSEGWKDRATRWEQTWEDIRRNVDGLSRRQP